MANPDSSIPVLIISSPNKPPSEFPITDDQISIGRAEQNKLVLVDERTSRNHAVLRRVGNTFSVTDLQSRNGTFVNGVQLDKGVSKQLAPGDEIRIGNFVLKLKSPVTPVSPDYDDLPLGGTICFMSAADLLRPLASTSTPEAPKVADSFGTSLAMRPDIVNRVPESVAGEIEVMAKRSKILGYVYELNKILNQEFAEEGIFEKISNYVFKVSNAGRIFFATISGEEVAIKWGKYRDEGVRQRYQGIPVSRTILRKVIDDRVSLLSIDPMSDPNLKTKDTFKLGRIRSVMCAPLLGQEDRVTGAIYVDRPEAIAFTEEDLNFLTAVASNAAMALENLKAHEKLLHDAETRLAYQRFLPQHVVDQILANPESLELGGVNQVATMMFADIRGFTSLSEKKTPQEIVYLLNNYFELAVAAIFENQGVLDKFIGDGIMAIFGAPQPTENDPLNAIRAAIAIQRVVRKVNEELALDGRDYKISVGVGINTGEVIAGYIGSKLRTDYTVIGDSVNLAARLESRAKPGQILIGKQTYALASLLMQGVSDDGSTAFAGNPGESSGFSMRQFGSLEVKGKKDPVQVYEVVWEGSPVETLGQ